jgi:uncharacterized protein YjiS (DUF1127 family)
MSAHTADSQFSFQLPSMSYIDAKWEEPNLRTPSATPNVSRKGALAAWLSRQFAAFTAWRVERVAAAELALLSDRELADIGLTRSDIGRVLQPAFNEDLRQRGTIL